MVGGASRSTLWPIGFMAWRIGNILDLHEQIDWIYEAGFDAVGFHASVGVSGQWEGIEPGSADEARRQRFLEQVERFAMAEIHAPFSSVLTSDALSSSVDSLLPVLDFAGEVGVDVVTIHAALPEDAGTGLASKWRQALERLNSCAVQNELLIGMEITEGFECVASLGMPNIGVTLDVGHMYFHDGRRLEPFGTIGDLVRSLGDTLVNLHMHDYDGTHDHIEPGTGMVDLTGVLVALSDIGYRRGMCLELNPDRVPPDGLRRSLAWMQEKMRELGLD